MEMLQQEEHLIGHLHAGKPVFAILTVDDELQLFRGNRNNFADLIRTGQELGFIAYVVTVKNLKLFKNKVRGYTYSEETKSWRQMLFPLPHIIYNRVPQREDEIQPEVKRKIAACIKHPGITLFNPSFFNKWDLFEWLRMSRTTKPFIPSTRRLLTVGGLKRMLKQYPFLYLKPVSGKAGTGIMSVQINPEKNMPYQLKTQRKRKSRTSSCSNLTRLWTRIKQNSNGASYIAQQGIELVSFQERSFDLRALVQKNARGQWDITGVGARVAGTKSITTHVPRGGSIEDPEKLLISSFGHEQARKIMVKARDATLLIAKQIERGAGSNLGEMSMDLGVDKEGQVWFFEANSKPMKFDEPHIRKKSLERIFQYSTYLLKRRSGGA